MPFEMKSEYSDDGTESFFCIDHDKPQDPPTLVFKVDSKKELIEFYPREEFITPMVEIQGFNSIPLKIISQKKGRFLAGLDYYFLKKFKGKKIKTFRIVKDGKSRFSKYKDGFTLMLSYKDLKALKDKLTELSIENKSERSVTVDEFFHKLFPNKFTFKKTPVRRRVARVINNLDPSIIEYLEADDVEKFLDFLESLLKGRYSSAARRRKLFGAAKIKVDEIALRETIEKFERMLCSDESEHIWGDFLQKHLFLIDSKYISVLREINVVLASQRMVDFGLVDSHGYLDLFEIKKPNTNLLSSKQDRGNYYWSPDAVKAITQAEKYLYNAERKASHLTEDIKRERNIGVSVVRPRAVVIMGHTKELDNIQRKEDFRILRNSLKNVEVITYDELLQRLKNQASKIYLE